MGCSWKFVSGNDNPLTEIEKPYWIGQFEITNEIFKVLYPDHDSKYVAQFWKDHTSRGYPVNNPDQPVVRISWEESMQFCEKLSETTGMNFSLPSDIQWEWACRAGAATPMWFGELDEDLMQRAHADDIGFEVINDCGCEFVDAFEHLVKSTLLS